MLVAMAVAALAFAVKLEVQRTKAAPIDAQIRQLLAAGAIAATAEFDLEPSQTVEVPTPPELDARLSITAEATESPGRGYTITVAYQGKSRSQRITTQMTDGGWQILTAELLRTSSVQTADVND
ncbi:MAG: hypothetical protein AAF078_02895 [Planctomycetota bacterium]